MSLLDKPPLPHKTKKITLFFTAKGPMRSKYYHLRTVYIDAV